MEVRVTREFRDKDGWHIIHKVGEVLSVTEDRGRELAALGLVESIEPPAPSEDDLSKRPKKRKQ